MAAMMNAQVLGAAAGAVGAAAVDAASSQVGRKESGFSGQRNAFFGANLKNRSGFSNGACRLRAKSQGQARRSGAGPLRVVAEKVVGIDLGTTNSAVAAMEGGKPTIVTNAEGQRTTPSVVAYTKNGDRLVGQIAKRQAVVNPTNTFFSVKRFIGRKMSEIDNESKQVSYQVIRDPNGNVKLDCPAIGKTFAAEEISAQVNFPHLILSPSSSFLLKLIDLGVVIRRFKQQGLIPCEEINVNIVSFVLCVV